MGVLENALVQVAMFVIPCDFIIMDIDKNSQVPLILRRPFMAIAGAVINVQAGTIFL